MALLLPRFIMIDDDFPDDADAKTPFLAPLSTTMAEES